MDLNKISNLIKVKRKEQGLTQNELAEKLFVTEKAISRWETGRGTPDISLLLPLAEALKIDVSALLNGEEKKKTKNDIEQLIIYNELVKTKKFNFLLKSVVVFYILSILLFLIYLRFEYDPNIELNYFVRLFIIIVSSLFLITGNKIYGNYYVEKLENKRKITKFSQTIVFFYYIILMFNVVIFARYNFVYGYNIVPFRSIFEIFQFGSFYSIVINIFGNLLVFMPLEYFMIELFNVNKFSKNLFISFITIFLIEIFQFIFRVGVFDVDDLILCVTGMMLFYIKYSKIKKTQF